MLINLQKLTNELRAAGISTAGNCSDSGIVWDDEGNEIQDRADVMALLAAHDPTPIIPEVIEYDVPIKAPDFIVATPDVESDPMLAMSAAVAEARKGKGRKKSMGKIVLNLVEYVDDLEKRVKKLEKK